MGKAERIRKDGRDISGGRIMESCESGYKVEIFFKVLWEAIKGFKWGLNNWMLG